MLSFCRPFWSWSQTSWVSLYFRTKNQYQIWLSLCTRFNWSDIICLIFDSHLSQQVEKTFTLGRLFWEFKKLFLLYELILIILPFLLELGVWLPSFASWPTTHWSFAEKTFVKQSMMLCVWNFAQIWHFGGGGKSSLPIWAKSSLPIWGGKSSLPIYPQITKYQLHQIVCTIYPPKIGKYDLPQIGSDNLPPPKSSSPIWSHGTFYLTSNVKGILGKISISESAFEERGRFFEFHHITFDYLLSTTI